LNDKAPKGNTALCLRKQVAMLGLVDAMFVQTTPTPIKYAMSTRGYCSPKMRLPLAEPSSASVRTIESAMTDFEKNSEYLTT
jgi:4-hydroxy-tetrahydrodipicolinate synthase